MSLGKPCLTRVRHLPGIGPGEHLLHLRLFAHVARCRGSRFLQLMEWRVKARTQTLRSQLDWSLKRVCL